LEARPDTYLCAQVKKRLIPGTSVECRAMSIEERVNNMVGEQSQRGTKQSWIGAWSKDHLTGGPAGKLLCQGLINVLQRVRELSRIEILNYVALLLQH
jgi:hypothetical protein